MTFGMREGLLKGQEPGRRTVARRILLAVFFVSFWWLPYRESTARVRTGIQVGFAVFYLGAAIWLMAGDHLALAVAAGVLGLVTVLLMRVVDRDMLEKDLAERARRAAQRARYVQGDAGRPAELRGPGHG